MRIGIDARTLDAAQLKGLGQYLQALLDGMLAADGGHEYLLFVDPRRAAVPRAPEHPQVRRVPVAAAGDEVWEQWAAPRAARRLGVEVFHSPANSMALRPSRPTVLTLHDLTVYELSKAWGRREHWYWTWIQRAACRRAGRIIAPSEFTKAQIVERLGISGDRIAVILNGISAAFGPREAQPVRGRLEALGVRRPFLFAAGARVRHKNLPALLEAFDRIAEAAPELELVLSSARGVAHLEEARARSRAAGRVRFLDYLPQEDLIALYNAAEAVVYPSLAEGFGFPPLEAMACGAPVVASRATSIPEVVGDAAILVDCTRPALIAEAVLALLRDPAQAEALRRRGRARAQQFRWDRAVAATLAVYAETR
jgi:glycosyltransferase involved in cell wall biosynthesis